MVNVSIGISQEILQGVFVCKIQRILYSDKNNNIILNSKSPFSHFPAQFVDNLPDK